MGMLNEGDYLNNPKHCPVPGVMMMGDYVERHEKRAIPPGFVAGMTLLAAACIAVSFLSAVLFVHLLKRHAVATIWVAIAVQLGVPAAFGVLAMQQGE